MISCISKNILVLFIAIGLGGCSSGIKPCIPEPPPPPKVKHVATADIEGRYKIDSTSSSGLSLFVKKVPTNSLETYWFYIV